VRGGREKGEIIKREERKEKRKEGERTQIGDREPMKGRVKEEERELKLLVRGKGESNCKKREGETVAY